MTTLGYTHVDKDALEAYSWRTNRPIEISADGDRAYVRHDGGYLWTNLTSNEADQ